MSDTSDMLDQFRRHGEAFANSETLAIFASRVGGGVGANLARYVGGWAEYSFRTAKAHGLDKAPSKPLYCPEAKTLADLVDEVRFIPTAPGGLYRDEAAAFVGNRVFLWGGPRESVGAKYGWAKNWLEKGERLRAQLRSGRDHATYVSPSKAAIEAWTTIIDSNPASLATIRLIEWKDGRTLAVASHCEGIFNLWLAVLDPGAADAMALMPDDDRALVAQERAAKAKAWPALPNPTGWWTVTGQDRQLGALGILSPFSTRVKAGSADDAANLAIEQRIAMGRENISFLRAEFEA